MRRRNVAGASVASDDPNAIDLDDEGDDAPDSDGDGDGAGSGADGGQEEVGHFTHPSFTSTDQDLVTSLRSMAGLLHQGV
jgi:hypothetical protein